MGLHAFLVLLHGFIIRGLKTQIKYFSVLHTLGILAPPAIATWELRCPVAPLSLFKLAKVLSLQGIGGQVTLGISLEYFRCPLLPFLTLKRWNDP